MQVSYFFSRVPHIVNSLLKNRLFLLFFLSMLIYNINFHPIPNYDTVTARVMPWSILETHSFNLDAFVDTLSFKMQTKYIDNYGHYLTVAPITLPVLITPLYAIPFLFVKILNIPISLNNSTFVVISLIAEKVVASLITSCSVVILYLVLKRLISERYALWGSVLYAFATCTWVISSQALWQHSMAELLLCLLFLIILWIIDAGSLTGYILLGVTSALFIMNRQADAIFLIPVFYFVLKNKPITKWVAYTLGLGLTAAPFIIYNVTYFGSIFGGYVANATLLQLTPNILVGLAGYTISPNRGLFFYSPILLFSLVGIWIVFKNKLILNNVLRNVLLLFALCIPLNLLIYCSFPVWWGGESFGYRYLVDSLPILAVFLGCAIEYLWSKKPSLSSVVKVIFAIFVIWSVLVQVCGAFYYYYDWDIKNSQHESVNTDPARVWNISDLQIFYGVSLDANPYSLLLHKLKENRSSSFNLTQSR